MDPALNSSLGAALPEESHYSTWFVVFLWLLALVMSLETVLGNILVLLAYRLDHHIQRHLSNQFIISLAISDLIIGLEGFPLLTVYVAAGQKWPLGELACQIWLTFRLHALLGLYFDSLADHSGPATDRSSTRRNTCNGRASQKSAG